MSIEKFVEYLKNEDFKRMTDELIKCYRTDKTEISDTINNFCKNHKDLILPLSVTLHHNSNSIGKVILYKYFPTGIVIIAKNISTDGYFYIKSKFNDGCLLLNQQNPFRSEECKKLDSYQVFAGTPVFLDENYLWQLTQVQDSKYFTVKFKGKSLNKPTLYISDENSSYQYLYASNHENQGQRSHFTLYIEDESCQALRLISRVSFNKKQFMAYVLDELDSIKKQDNQIYVYVSPNECGQKTVWNLISQNTQLLKQYDNSCIDSYESPLGHQSDDIQDDSTYACGENVKINEMDIDQIDLSSLVGFQFSLSSLVDSVQQSSNIIKIPLFFIYLVTIIQMFQAFIYHYIDFITR